MVRRPVTSDPGPSLPPAKPPPKHYGCGTLIMGLIVLVIVVSCYESVRTPNSTTSTPAAPLPSTPPETPEERFERLVTSMEDADGPRGRRLHAAKTIAEEFPDAEQAEAAAALVAELEEEIRKENLGKQWVYHASEDAMTSKPIRSATVRSNNTFQFGFPYSGTQRATLSIRRHPRWGNDVIFKIEKGQILCSSYGDCRIRVRFDDGTVRTLRGNPPSDNSTETAFIPGYNDFLRRMQNAKLVRVEVDIYQEGPLTAEFNVEGFDPARLQ